MGKVNESNGCSMMGCMSWMITTSFKLSSLLVLVALLATVHNMRLDSDNAVSKLMKAEDNLAFAVQQKQAAIGSTTDSIQQMNKLHTELADTSAEVQRLQVELIKRQEVEQQAAEASRQQAAEASRQQAAQAQQTVNELTDQLRQLEAGSAAQSQTASRLQQLTEEKSSVDNELKDVKTALRSTEGKLGESEQRLEMLMAKEKGQDLKIQQLQEDIAKLSKKN